MTRHLGPPRSLLITALEHYRRLSNTVFELYASDRQREALAALKDRPTSLTPWRAELAHLEACLHGSIGQPDEAFAALTSAHDAGSWWDPRILLEDDDLEALRESPAFVDLVESSRARWQAANAELDRGGDLLELPTGRPAGLLVALHGAEEDGTDALRAWRGAVDCGFAVHAVRSSQRTSPRYRSWPDAERAESELADARAALPDELRRLPVVAAGFSAGGRVALRWALTAAPHPVTGVVTVAPAVIPADLPPSRAAGLAPARLVVGSEDDLLEDVRATGRHLSPAGFGVDVVPGLGHEFPADFGERLARLLRPATR